MYRCVFLKLVDCMADIVLQAEPRTSGRCRGVLQEKGGPTISSIIHTVRFHNFKSQNFKLSVSNPKNKHVAYVSVLSQISNCQGLGRKNKHEILKTCRRVV